jgi:hypothetical protein
MVWSYIRKWKLSEEAQEALLTTPELLQEYACHWGLSAGMLSKLKGERK